MERKCINCVNWCPDQKDADGDAWCKLIEVHTRPGGGCPGFKNPNLSEEEKQALEEKNKVLSEKVQQLLATPNKPAPQKKERTHSQVVTKRKFRIEPMLVRHDPYRPNLIPFGHQARAIARYEHEDDIPLFFEMGCGKSFTTLQIAQKKFLNGDIKGLLIVAPNDVHRQWFDELVFGVDVHNDGVFWQEMQIDFEAQCVGGRGGQKELYPFQTEDLFKFVSVNVDTFSQPHKWEEIVFWANMNNYMIAIDEATVIKNPSSKRSQRLLYEFNDIKKHGKTIISSIKKHPVRAVLTGTPVTNGPIDLWAIMEFVHPNYFGRNYYSFRSYFGMFTKLTVETSYGAAREVDVLLTDKTWKGIHNCESYQEAQILFGCSEDTYMTIKHQDHFIGPYKHADELKKMLERTAMFVKLTDCVDMPSVQYMERRVGMSDAQKAVYDSMRKDLLAQYGSYQTTASNKLVVSLRLQQISSGFIMGKKVIDEAGWDLSVFGDDVGNIDERDLTPDEVIWIGDSNPKLDALMRDVAECDKPLLILTRYSAEAAKIYELCEKAGYRTGLFTGWKVVGGVDAFKAGELDILVANSTKISRGFNLQIAHTTLFYSNTFSMEIRQQAEFRTFRMGQTHPCLYIDYSCADVDDTINKALKLKKGLLEYIRDKDLEEVA
jgi:Superfamily II DNA/RNA helicases, SNF2 family